MDNCTCKIPNLDIEGIGIKNCSRCGKSILIKKELYHGDKCPICNGGIKASGFNGNLFCWGKCYCYINSQKYQELLKETYAKR